MWDCSQKNSSWVSCGPTGKRKNHHRGLFGLWKTVLEKCFVIAYFRCQFQVRHRLFIFKLYRKSLKLRGILKVSVNSVFCLSSGQTSQALFPSEAVFGKVLFVFSPCAFFSFPLKFPHKTVRDLVKTAFGGPAVPRVTVGMGVGGGGRLQDTEKCHYFIINKKQMRKIVCMFVRCQKWKLFALATNPCLFCCCCCGGEEIGPKSLNPLCAEQHHMVTINDPLFSSCTPIPLVITLVF